MIVYSYFLLLAVVFSNAEDDYLLDTPGCKIPNYYLSIPNEDKNISCGERQIFVEKISDYDVIFHNSNNLRDCCYKYLKTDFYNDFYGIQYTKCKPFANGDRVRLKYDFVSVTCKNYEDIYAFTKKITSKPQKKDQQKHHWNVVLLGLDRTSRTRAYNSLPSTFRYLQHEHWLDFRGYNKVGQNTYPNLVEALTGKTESAYESSCSLGISECNHLMVWSEFKKAGYITAYGEDSLHLPDTFYKGKGFRKKPTDHFMRPLFKASEKEIVGTVCSRKVTSGEQILNYILDFVETYKTENFFGFFWISSFSHTEYNALRNFDSIIESFLKELAYVENTFIIFFSDHGMRYGEQKKYVESFYEDRLPMLFIKVPPNLHVAFPNLYSNLIHNQNRLVSTKDLHLTIKNLLKRKNDYTSHPTLEECPKCQSLLKKISMYRTCSEAGISDYYCACRDLKATSLKEYGTMYSVIKLISKVQNRSKAVRTTQCNYCQALSVKEVIRSHYFKDGNNTYYLSAFTMTPGNMGFEGMVLKNQDYVYKVLQPISSISTWRMSGACAVQRADRAFCVCRRKKPCHRFKKKTLPRVQVLYGNPWKSWKTWW